MILSQGSDPEQVALTFDDGPSRYTFDVLEVLRKHKAKATFFLVGKHLEAYPMPAELAVTEGHEIGNHSMNHLALGQLPSGNATAEIFECQREIYHALGVTPAWFRPPYGNYSTETIKIAANIGLKPVLWSQLSGDWFRTKPEDIFSNVNLDTDKGEIVLLHDGSPDGKGDRSATVKAVEMILEKWPNKKYVTLSEITQ